MDKNNPLDDNLNKESSEIDFKEIYFILSSNFNMIISSVIISFLVSIIYIYCSIPLYQSYASILVESSSNQLSLFSNMGMSENANTIDNEVEILKSRNTINRVLNQFINTDEYKNMYLFNNKDYDLPDVNSLFRKVFLVDYFSNQRPVKINDQFQIKLLVESLRSRLSINKIRNTDVIEISLLSPDPNESARIVNRLISAYQSVDKEWNNGEMIHMKTFLDSQIDFKEQELNEVENKLSEFQKKEEIYGLDGNSELLLKQLTLIESDYYSNQAQENILEERKKYLYNELTEEEKLLTERVMNTINERLFALKSEIAQRESDLISTIALQGEEHQAVTSGRKTLNKLKETLKQQTNLLISQGVSIGDPIEYRQALMDTILVIEASQALFASKSKELNKLVKKYEHELSILPNKALTFSRLARERNILSETYAIMMQKREEAKISEASQLGKIRIVDLAYPDIVPVKPKKISILILFLFMGVFLGALLSFLKEYLDNTIKTLYEIERFNLEILAMIPTIGVNYKDDKGNNKKQTKKIERTLITHEDSKSPVSEAYRTLRTNLMYRFSDIKSGQAILFSSPGPGEGKTTSIANLAITFANLGKKTLLVDTDLRKPVMHKVFNQNQSPGLTDYLLENSNDIDKLPRATDTENLSIITSGSVPPYPSEILGADKMQSLVEELKKKWDIVLFDLPPLMAVTDAYVMLKHMDHFVLVVRSGVTQKGALKRCITYLRMANLNETGVVVNQIDKTRSSNDEGFDYYQQYYGMEESS